MITLMTNVHRVLNRPMQQGERGSGRFGRLEKCDNINPESPVLLPETIPERRTLTVTCHTTLKQRSLAAAPRPPTRQQRIRDVTRISCSIVFHVETTLFHVHRSMPSMHSEVFTDMLQPPNHDIIEGCSVVHLPDSAYDFIHLLKALYDPL